MDWDCIESLEAGIRTVQRGLYLELLVKKRNRACSAEGIRSLCCSLQFVVYRIRLLLFTNHGSFTTALCGRYLLCCIQRNQLRCVNYGNSATKRSESQWKWVSFDHPREFSSRKYACSTFNQLHIWLPREREGWCNKFRLWIAMRENENPFLHDWGDCDIDGGITDSSSLIRYFYLPPLNFLIPVLSRFHGLFAEEIQIKFWRPPL